MHTISQNLTQKQSFIALIPSGMQTRIGASERPSGTFGNHPQVEQLKAKGVEVLGHVDEGYGKFAWILDPDGVKIELWEQLAAPE